MEDIIQVRIVKQTVNKEFETLDEPTYKVEYQVNPEKDLWELVILDDSDNFNIKYARRLSIKSATDIAKNAFYSLNKIHIKKSEEVFENEIVKVIKSIKDI